LVPDCSAMFWISPTHPSFLFLYRATSICSFQKEREERDLRCSQSKS
jgi:hypothetical protein